MKRVDDTARIIAIETNPVKLRRAGCNAGAACRLPATVLWLDMAQPPAAVAGLDASAALLTHTRNIQEIHALEEKALSD